MNTQAGYGHDTVLNTHGHGDTSVTVSWWGAQDDLPPTPQWFVGQARRYGGRLRLIHKGTSRTPWSGDLTVSYTFHRAPADA